VATQDNKVGYKAMQYMAGAFNGGEIIQRRQALAPCQWRQRQLKVGGTKRRRGWACGEKTGCSPPHWRRGLHGERSFFVLWSRSGIFWWLLRC